MAERTLPLPDLTLAHTSLWDCAQPPQGPSLEPVVTAFGRGGKPHGLWTPSLQSSNFFSNLSALLLQGKVVISQL